jgi:hypothetical protein
MTWPGDLRGTPDEPDRHVSPGTLEKRIQLMLEDWSAEDQFEVISCHP